MKTLLYVFYNMFPTNRWGDASISWCHNNYEFTVTEIGSIDTRDLFYKPLLINFYEYEI